MEPYMDRTVVRARMEEARKGFVDTYTGMYAGDRLLQFEERELFAEGDRPGPIKIRLPVSSTVMEPERARRKYPSEDRPQAIYTDERGCVDFTFSLFSQRVGPDQIRGALMRYQVLIKKCRQDASILEKGIYPMEKGCGGWFTFRQEALDEEIAGLLALIGTERYLVLCMCSCPYDEREEQEPVMHQVIQTIREMGQIEKGPGSAPRVRPVICAKHEA